LQILHLKVIETVADIVPRSREERTMQDVKIKTLVSCPQIIQPSTAARRLDIYKELVLIYKKRAWNPPEGENTDQICSCSSAVGSTQPSQVSGK
jgi:hypothetical protein